VASRRLVLRHGATLAVAGERLAVLGLVVVNASGIDRTREHVAECRRWRHGKRLAILLAMSEVTRILSQIEAGNPHAAEKLLPLVYDELRKLAQLRLSNEASGQTLSATSLVHEAYIRLVDDNAALQWDSRGHFFAAAAEAMRRILVESARRKQRVKHGGNHERVDLTETCVITDGPSLDILALDEALTRLAAADPSKAELVKLRYFAGLKMTEAAQALGISVSTAERHWAFAKSWLYSELRD
jgi:RNA polymerase sigma factor (TIGR02999 family)